MGFFQRYKLARTQYYRDLRLAKAINQQYQQLLRSAGNKREVLKQSKELNTLLDKIQQTKLYGFISTDVQRIRHRLAYVRAHPKEHKIAYVAAGVYIVAPGTFELTGIILFIRYTIKYIFSFRKKIPPIYSLPPP